MAEDRNDIFHCLKCGRIAYEPHGTFAAAGLLRPTDGAGRRRRRKAGSRRRRREIASRK